MMNATENKMTQATLKAQANAILKNLGLGYIKASTGDFGSRDVVLEPREKGLRGGSMGPLTVTDAHFDHSAKVQRAVYDAFSAIPEALVTWETCYAGHTHKLSNVRVVIALDEKKARVLNFYWRAYKTYTRAARLDEGYVTYWLVCESEDKKRSEM
jgi:hypothetical protein